MRQRQLHGEEDEESLPRLRRVGEADSSGASQKPEEAANELQKETLYYEVSSSGRILALISIKVRTVGCQRRCSGLRRTRGA